MPRCFLLADDDADDRELFSEALSYIEPIVMCHCVCDGNEVMEKLGNNEFLIPDIIFLDINMPRMNGWECLSKLKATAAYKHIPVIMFSTSSRQHDANIAINLGALCFFTKPSDFNQLKTILEIIAANVEGNIVEAIKKFEGIISHKIIACS